MSEILVSVVVPVWNPGRHIEPCIASLLAQTLPADQLELLFVDDGSTDGTGERLDELAAAHPHVRVRHEPNSGWAGRPRNVGVAAATGRWVQFVDQDDWMAPDALRRLAALGDEGDADIVIGKVTSDFRPVNHELFARNLTHATLTDAPLFTSLTPHKMFRREFLEAHRLRFPEGRVRLEDQLFMTQAFCAARSTAVLADYNCYHYVRRSDEGNAGSHREPPATYFRYAEGVLDAIEELAPSDEARTIMLRRSLRNEVLRRVRSPKMHDWSPRYRAALIDVTSDLVSRRYPRSVRDGMVVVDRLATELLVARDTDALFGLIDRAEQIGLDARVELVRWTGRAWRLDLTAGLQHADGRPLELVRLAGDRWGVEEQQLRPTDAPRTLDVTDDLAALDVATLLVHQRTRMTWFAPTTWSHRIEPVGDGSRGRLVLSGTATLDLTGAASREPLGTGTWQVKVRLRVMGLHRSVRLPVPPRTTGSELLRPALFGRNKVISPVAGGRGRLAIHVGHGALLVDDLAKQGVRSTTVDAEGRLDAELHTLPGGRSTVVPLRLRLTRRSTRGAWLPAQARVEGGVVHLRTAVALTVEGGDSGRWAIEAAGAKSAGVAVGSASMRHGRPVRVELGPTAAQRTARAAVPSGAGTAVGQFGRALRRVARRGGRAAR